MISLISDDSISKIFDFIISGISPSVTLPKYPLLDFESSSTLYVTDIFEKDTLFLSSEKAFSASEITVDLSSFTGNTR